MARSTWGRLLGKSNGKGYVPRQGDVVWLDFHPQLGREQSGRRPGVVLTPRSYNGKVGIAILCPISTKVKGYPFEVAIPAGLPVQGVVLSDHVKSFDWRARQARLLCRLPESVVDEVLRTLYTLLRREVPRA